MGWVDEHTGEGQHALLATGEGGGALRVSFAQPREERVCTFEPTRDLFAAAGVWHPERPVLVDRERPEHRTALRGVDDPPTRDLPCLQVRDVVSLEQQRAVVDRY